MAFVQVSVSLLFLLPRSELTSPDPSIGDGLFQAFLREAEPDLVGLVQGEGVRQVFRESLDSNNNNN